MLPSLVTKLFQKIKDVWLTLKKAFFKKAGMATCLCFMGVLCLIPFILLSLWLRDHLNGPEYFTLHIYTQNPTEFIVDENFLSLGLDSSVITEGFKNFNMTSPKLIKMVKYLSPAYLRIGGNQADQIVFSIDDETPDIFDNVSSFYNETELYTLSSSNWLKLYELSKEANINIIYDLNSLLRYKNNSWNSLNAEKMINFSNQRNLLVNWELGNEPNSYEHKFNKYVNATQLGLDFKVLRNILNKYEMYNKSYLVGPSTTRLRTKDIERYFADFLRQGSEYINAITWHHYYFSGINATKDEFLDPKIFNHLECHIKRVSIIVQELNLHNKPIWLGETSSAWHGGAPNLSDRFIGSFLWADKLGLSAKLGVSVVIRQSIFKGDYALLNDSYYPNPDWWLSILYKNLVGNKVVTTKSEGDEKIRLYAHCAKEVFHGINMQSKNSSVVVFGVNIGNNEGLVKIEELHYDKSVYTFELTSKTLLSQFVYLNAKLLELSPNLDLPEIQPRIIHKSKSYKMPPYSIVFWIFTNTNANACTN